MRSCCFCCCCCCCCLTIHPGWRLVVFSMVSLGHANVPKFRAMRNWHVPWPNMDRFWLAFLKMNMEPLKIDVFLIFQVSIFKTPAWWHQLQFITDIVFLEHLRGCRPLILRHIHIYIFGLFFLSIEQYYSLELTVPSRILTQKWG